MDDPVLHPRAFPRAVVHRPLRGDGARRAISGTAGSGCTAHGAPRGMRGALAGLLTCVLACGGLAASGQGAAGWRNAEPGRILQLPADHASHPDYRIEWWYYTGNVRSTDGRRFGYQLTFFRIGVDPAPANPSRWTVRDLFMAHFAIT